MKANKKSNQQKPKIIRKKIIGQIQKFRELSGKTTVVIPANATLKNIINSESLNKIRLISNKITQEWNKDDLDLNKWLTLTEDLSQAYVNLIFRTGFIVDEEARKKLDEIPQALREIVKEGRNLESD
jgi:hypothetical protein